MLVRCYGEHSSMWCDSGMLAPWLPASDGDIDPRVARMQSWGKANNKCGNLRAIVLERSQSTSVKCVLVGP